MLIAYSALDWWILQNQSIVYERRRWGRLAMCDDDGSDWPLCDWWTTAWYRRRLSLSVISDRSRNNTARVLFAWLMATGSGCGLAELRERERERGRSFTMDRDRVLPNFILPPGIYRRASRAPLCDPLCADWWRPLSSPQICYTQSLDQLSHYEGDSTLWSANDKRDKLKGRSQKSTES